MAIDEAGIPDLIKTAGPRSDTELRAFIAECLVELERLGWIYRTGEFRRGQAVHALTSLGRRMLRVPCDGAAPQ
jgi:hypothetical protein